LIFLKKRIEAQFKGPNGYILALIWG